jgi:16S rRNA (guanine527-N7)-methyltransferase
MNNLHHSDEIEHLLSGAVELNAPLDRDRGLALLRYLEILEEANKSFNLTRIPRKDGVQLHLFDSLATLKAIPDPRKIQRILDIGSGAGFPGVPLAAALPEASVTLLDSTLKKVRFVDEGAKLCGITNCLGVHERAEKLAKHPTHRASYDLVVARAVAQFDGLIALMMPFVKPGGIAIALKGAKANEEVRGTEGLIRNLGGEAAKVLTLTLPKSDLERFLIVVNKRRR